MKKYIAEFIGTAVLVLFGCGSAVIAGSAVGTLGIAVAFGLAIVAMAYSIGNISGCHVNPAVSLAMLISKKMTPKDFCGYVVAQVAGAVCGAALLWLIAGSNSNLGQNVCAESVTLGIGFLVETILTFTFVLAILGVTSKTENATISGLVIGLTLTFVHILGIPLTGTSVNPARSIGPAIFVGGEAISQLWLFILAPLVGGAIAAVVWKYLAKEE